MVRRRFSIVVSCSLGSLFNKPRHLTWIPPYRFNKTNNTHMPVQDQIEILSNDITAHMSLARTWFVPLSVCDHSQGVFFPTNTGGGV